MHPISWLKGLGAGAAGMFFLDPRLGKQRQALAVDELTQMAAGWVRGFDRAVSGLTDRIGGAWEEVVGALDTRQPTDEVVAERVRSKLGRLVTYPQAIEVEVADGAVSLRGAVLSEEADCLLECVGSVPGVQDVQDELSREDEGESIAELQGEELEDEDEVPFFARSPGMRLAAGAVGALLMTNCVLRRRPTSILLGAVGFALLAQASSARGMTDSSGTAKRSRRDRVEDDDETAEAWTGEPIDAAEESRHGVETAESDDSTEMSEATELGDEAETAETMETTPSAETTDTAATDELTDTERTKGN